MLSHDDLPKQKILNENSADSSKRVIDPLIIKSSKVVQDTLPAGTEKTETMIDLSCGEDDDNQPEDLEEGELDDPEARTLLIQNLAPKTTNELLLHSFLPYGKVMAASVVSRPRRITIGLVEFLKHSEAECALQSFELRTSVHPRLGKVKVSWASISNTLPHPSSSSSLLPKDSILPPPPPVTTGVPQLLPLELEEEPAESKLRPGHVNQSTQTDMIDGFVNGNPVIIVPSLGALVTQAALQKINRDLDAEHEVKGNNDTNFRGNEDSWTYLYVPYMPKATTSEELLKLFAPFTYAEQSCRCVSYERKDTNTSFGIIAYTQESDSLAAMSALLGTDPFDIDVALQIEPAGNKKALRIARLPEETRLSSVLHLLEPFGDIKASRIIPVEDNDRLHHTEARIEYHENGAAVRALVTINKKKVDVCSMDGKVSSLQIQLELL